MTIEIAKETSSPAELKHGHTVVSVIRVKLCEANRADRGILLKCPGSNDNTPDLEGNTYPVYVGSARVTADRARGTGGIPIMPGESLHIPADNPALIYVISPSGDQDVAWILL